MMITLFDKQDISLQRAALRATARAERAAMPAPYRAHKSVELCKRLQESLMLTLGITGIQPADAVVAGYAAFPEEVDLSDFIEFAYAQGCQVAFPCMMHDARVAEGCEVQQTMEMRIVPAEHFYQGEAPFIKHPLRRYEHKSAELAAFPYVAADNLTMMVVPVVAFDAQGNRLGYGQGNYDRYLAQVPASCRVAGVAFAEQQVAAIPVEEHDRALAVLAL